MGGSPFIRWNGAETNIIFDGNSLVAGVGATGGQDICTQLAALSPLNGNVNITNLGVGGRSIEDMITNGATVDAAYVAGKKNVLLAWEGTNSIIAHQITGAAAGALMTTYCADRLAAHSDYIIIPVTTIAREATWSDQNLNTTNNALVDYDNYLLSNYLAMGAKAVVWLRSPGSIFEFTAYTTAAFEASPYINYEAAGEVGAHVHLNNLGYAAAAQIITNVLRTLRAR